MSISFVLKSLCASVLAVALFGGSYAHAQQSATNESEKKEESSSTSKSGATPSQQATQDADSNQDRSADSDPTDRDSVDRRNAERKSGRESSGRDRNDRDSASRSIQENGTTGSRNHRNDEDQFRFDQRSDQDDDSYRRRAYDQGYRPRPPRDSDVYDDEPSSGTLRGAYDENRESERRSYSNQTDERMDRRDRDYARDDDYDRDRRDRDDDRYERDRDVALGLRVDIDNSDRLVVRDTYSRGLFGRTNIRPGDVIIAVDGEPVRSRQALMHYVYSYRGRGQLPIVVLRNGSRQTIYVNAPTDGYVDDAPELFAWEDEESAWLGVYLNAQYENSAVVQGVQEGSAADQAGLRANDWIVSVNGQRIMSPRHLSQVIRDMQPGERIRMNVSRRVTGELQATLSERQQSRNARDDRSRPERPVNYEE